MIKTGANSGTIKEIKARDQKEKEEAIIDKCQALAAERIGSRDELLKLNNQYKGGIWYLPIIGEDGEIEKMAIMKPIDRNILSYASTKITDEGLYAFLEACMRECIIEVQGKTMNDAEILEDDEYFIPAANSFNKILEGKKAFLLKR